MEKILVFENHDCFQDLFENVIFDNYQIVYTSSPSDLISKIENEGAIIAIVECFDRNWLWRLSKSWVKVPTIGIFESDNLSEMMSLIESTFDDFLVMPVEKKELELRIQILIHKHFRRENVIKIEDVELLTDRKTVRICNEDFQLRRKEYMILELLMQNPDKTFSAEEIYEYIWKQDFLDNDRH